MDCVLPGEGGGGGVGGGWGPPVGGRVDAVHQGRSPSRTQSIKDAVHQGTLMVQVDRKRGGERRLLGRKVSIFVKTRSLNGFDILEVSPKKKLLNETFTFCQNKEP